MKRIKRTIVAVLSVAISISFCVPAHAEDTVCNHHWEFSGRYQKLDDEYHAPIYECSLCEETKVEESEKRSHNDGSWYDPDQEEWHDNRYFKIVDSTKHSLMYKCEECGAIITDYTANHEFDYRMEYFKNLNDTYHGDIGYCICGAQKVTWKEKHEFQVDKCIKEATLSKSGSVRFSCLNCDKTITKSVSWKRGTDYSVDYGVYQWNNVYSTSKKVMLWSKAPKGSVVKLTIGGKTYKKKKGKKALVSFKLKKKPKYGKKFKVKVYYKGKLIGSDWDYIYSGKKIKRGMTKKQLKWLTTRFWAHPDDTSSASGGWSYWFYDDGSYIIFRNGKVKDWYRA